ncbi:flagellar assembly protein T N-terminal domain-containing protein [Echinimonas agarilytica]|uniref:Flagellar assembly protein FlgT n=1 Tax=Echinimonas agarilytica TaxID=1215918 RepID=A0AA42B7I0_9GAMM|nr:flagellar assembly protein T N-terminal domain-containing protein [Echinimonas agarilytica]MCM2680080.1 flagellar assembly protein FlgT [Echinimonas agarilytica]
MFRALASLLKLCLIGVAAVCSFSAQAQWYEASGSAYVIDGNIERARQEATEDAIRAASMFAGVSVASLQSVNNGVLTEDNYSFESNSEIAQVHIVSEIHSGDQITIHVRADIFAEPVCASSGLNHTLAIARFPIAHRQQAQHGSIFELGGATSKVLHGMFQENSQSVQSHLWLDEVVAYQPGKLEPMPEVDELARTLARRTNSQYVLIGHVRDISVTQEESVNITFWTYKAKPRTLALELDLIDGISGERVERLRYIDSVEWDFPPEQKVDPYSADFWTSSYGKAWLRMLQDVQTDIENALACQPSIANIVHRQKQGVIVNMGSQDGILQGQTASVSRLGTFLDTFGRVKNTLQTSDIILQVHAVEARQAFLKPKRQSDLANIQNNDVVMFKTTRKSDFD